MLKDVGIMRFTMAESEDDPQKTATYMEQETKARDVLNKRLAVAKKELQHDYSTEVDDAWLEYKTAKEAAEDELAKELFSAP